MPKIAVAARHAMPVKRVRTNRFGSSPGGKIRGASTRSSRIRSMPAQTRERAHRSEQTRLGQQRNNQAPPSGPGARTASSRSRKEARTSIRLATLAHAISNRKIAEPISARIAAALPPPDAAAWARPVCNIQRFSQSGILARFLRHVIGCGLRLFERHSGFHLPPTLEN